MFNKSKIEDKIRKEVNTAQRIQALEKQIRELEADKWNVKDAEAKLRKSEAEVVSLKADLKIAEANVVKAKAEAKAEFADAIIELEDSRTEALNEVYGQYADKLVEVVKAAHSFTGLPQNATTVNNTTAGAK